MPGTLWFESVASLLFKLLLLVDVVFKEQFEFTDKLINEFMCTPSSLTQFPFTFLYYCGAFVTSDEIILTHY